MERLNEKLWPIVKEYTRQVAELLDCSEWHWIGTDDDGERPVDVCDFGGVMFFTLEDMQVIIDRLDEWVKHYGSREAVAQEISDWFDWWLDDSSPEADASGTSAANTLVELYETRCNRYMRTRPRINLESWLSGCPRDPWKPTIEDEILTMECQRNVLKELIEKYRGARSLWNIFDALGAEIKEKKDIKEKRDEKLNEQMKETEAYKNFAQAINEHSERSGDF